MSSSQTRSGTQPWLEWEMEAASGLCALVKSILGSAGANEVRSNVLSGIMLALLDPGPERMQYHSDKELAVLEMTALIESEEAPQVSVMAVNQWAS